MHNMHSNRVSNQGTSMLSDNSIQKISNVVNDANEKRAFRHGKNTQIKKTASVAKNTSKEREDNNSKRIIVASLNEIPDYFERIGTGFYREGHHLWELIPGKGGFVLSRKHGEDHVLGYDPEPIQKESSITVTDRFGTELKKGCRVRLPLSGKIATGTVLVVTPGVLDVGLDAGGEASVPPGMTEFLQEEKSEGEHSPETLHALETFLEEESEEEEHGGDKDAGSVFEPEISEKPKSDYVGPQSSQTGGIGGIAAEEEDDDRVAKKVAKDVGQDPAVEPPSVTSPEVPTFEPGISGRLGEVLEFYDVVSVFSEDMNRTFLVAKSGNKYDVRIERLERLGLWGEPELRQFEESLGKYEVHPMTDQVVAMVKQAMVAIDDMADSMKEWSDYWKSVGIRVAQASPKPKAPPKPKMTEEEKRQKQKERRKQRAIERAGLPKGTKLPPRPKVSAKDTDELAELKEIIRMYEQNVDELNFTINNIEPDDPNADALAIDAVEVFLSNIEEEKGETEEEDEIETEDELSLETPSNLELEMQASKTEHVVVSMSDL